MIEYLQVGWAEGPLRTLISDAGLTPRQALRETRSPAKALGLLEPGVTDEQILAAMLVDPVLVNRPFVVSPKGVRLCRPSEAVLDLLDRFPPGPFYKEDGALMIDADGRPV